VWFLGLGFRLRIAGLCLGGGTAVRDERNAAAVDLKCGPRPTKFSIHTFTIDIRLLSKRMSGSLFGDEDFAPSSTTASDAPIAESLSSRHARKKSIGLEDLLETGASSERDRDRPIPSMIFWGTSGIGERPWPDPSPEDRRHTLRHAQRTSSGIKAIKTRLEEARKGTRCRGSKDHQSSSTTITLQQAPQDAFLPYSSRGTSS